MRPGRETHKGGGTVPEGRPLPIRTWKYTDEDSTVRHMGPTAQDFHAAFGLGGTETAIATVDADGIALTGVQALVRRTSRDAARITNLEALVAELQERVAALTVTLERVR